MQMGNCKISQKLAYCMIIYLKIFLFFSLSGEKPQPNIFPIPYTSLKNEVKKIKIMFNFQLQG